MTKIVVAGNPNAGKTCIFNNLTGSNQRVGNYAGVTVEFTEGKTQFNGKKVTVIDLPGTYSLAAYSQEEVVARNFILDEDVDVVINVVDASNLERNLYLTAQIIELDVPLVLVLNMYDIAEKKGMTIDIAYLEKILGVKVVTSIANKREGMAALKNACMETIEKGLRPKRLSYSHELDAVLPDLCAAIEKHKSICLERNPLWFSLKLLEDDKIISEMLNRYDDVNDIKDKLCVAQAHLLKHSGEDGCTVVAEARYAFASGACRRVLTQPLNDKKMLTSFLDSVACHRIFGPVVLCFVIIALFIFSVCVGQEWQWIPIGRGLWTSPLGLFEMFFEWLATVVTANVQEGALRSMLCDGVIGGVGGVLGFTPLIFCMFMFLSFLEDSGYLARVAFVLDRVLRIFGLQGKSILSLIVSGGIPGGCAVPGVMATRTLRDEKDRIVTILIAPFMNCGAKMPVYAMLISAFFPGAWMKIIMLLILTCLSWFFALISAVVIRKFIVKGEQTPFVMELPLYHMPTFRGVMMDTWARTWQYIKKAGTVILAISILMWASLYYPRCDDSIFVQEKIAATKIVIAEMASSIYAPVVTLETIDSTAESVTMYTGNDEGIENLENNLAANIMSHNTSAEALHFDNYLEKVVVIDNERNKMQLLNSFSGRLGTQIEPISQFAGFDWKDNIALIGGFAAKEVIIGTLSTAYSMGEVDADASDGLQVKLKNSDSWSPLKAFAMMIFVMIYAPCFVTIAAIKKETGSWLWPLFSMSYNTTLGFVLAVLIYQIGGLFV